MGTYVSFPPPVHSIQSGGVVQKILSQPKKKSFSSTSSSLGHSALLSFFPSSVHQMSSSFPFPLPLNPLISFHHRPRTLFPLSLSKPSFSPTHICFSSTSPTPDRQDFLWLREEQRWLREEQRWLREEQRWLRERHSLLTEIQFLKLQIQALENRISLQEEVSVSPEKIRQVGPLLPKSLVAESGSSVSPTALDEKVKGVEREEKKEKRKVLRKGSEGAEVREMQVWFQ